MYSSYPQDDPIKRRKKSKRSKYPQQQQPKAHQLIGSAVFYVHIKTSRNFSSTCPKTEKGLERQSNRF